MSRNIIANYAGSSWVALMSLIFVPLYVRLMGIESYGLVAFYASFLVILSLLDLGLSMTLNRELARLSALENAQQEMRDLVRTLEIIFWSVAAGMGLGIALLAPIIARDWVKPQQLSASSVEEAIILMAAVIAFRWPLYLYSGGLLGLQKQVLLNWITGVAATLRGGGAIVVLWWVSPTIQTFFSWQIVVSALETLAAAYCLSQATPRSTRNGRFQTDMLRRIWRYSAGVTGIAFMSLIVLQMDKIILSKMLTLEMFGYYTLAWAVSACLLRVVVPIQNALFPRFSQMIAISDEAALSNLYHKGCQFISVVMVPGAAIIALFSREVLTLWAGEAVATQNTCVILSLLLIGTTLNGLLYLPYLLQLAHGWTSLCLRVNAVAAVLLVPSLIWMAGRYGPVGAAIVWITLNAGSVLIMVRIMHQRIIKGDQWRWYIQDVGIPAMAALAVALPARWCVPGNMSTAMTITYVTSAWALSTAASFWASPLLRRGVSHLILGWLRAGVAEIADSALWQRKS